MYQCRSALKILSKSVCNILSKRNVAKRTTRTSRLNCFHATLLLCSLYHSRAIVRILSKSVGSYVFVSKHKASLLGGVGVYAFISCMVMLFHCERIISGHYVAQYIKFIVRLPQYIVIFVHLSDYSDNIYHHESALNSDIIGCTLFLHFLVFIIPALILPLK